MFARFTTLLLVCIIVCVVQSLHIDVETGGQRCISQELDSLEYAAFAFTASSRNKDETQRVIATVKDPLKNTFFNERLTVNAKPKEVEHKVETRGAFEMCFQVYGGGNSNAPVRVFFHVDYKPRTADGYSRKVAKGDIPSLSDQIPIIEAKLKEISVEIEHARVQELALKEAGENTSSRIQWFSVLSIAVLLITALWQIIYLRRFFASKKLL